MEKLVDPPSIDSNLPENLTLEPDRPGFYASPYEQYKVLRRESPVHLHPSGVWMVFKEADVVRVLRDPQLSASEQYAVDTPRGQMLLAGLGQEQLFRQTLPRVDPPAHGRLRRRLSVPFTPRNIEKWRGRIEAIVDSSIERLGTSGSVDLLGDIARPLAYQITCEIIGMPDGGDEDLLVTASHAYVAVGMEPFGVTPERIAAAQSAYSLLYTGFQEAVAWKREHLEDDLLSAMIASNREGLFSDRELIDQVGLLFTAGHTTTFSAVGLAVVALMNNRDQWDTLCADPGLLNNAIEECLRFDNTIQATRRTTPTAFAIGGVTIPAGSIIFPWQGSANRDEDRWGPTADRLDITRSGLDKHSSFGSGPHLCLGAWLARAEMQTVIGKLARLFPRMELSAQPQWQELLSMRGPVEVVLSL